MTFNKIRSDIELIFDQYRKHKYYTLFINNYNTSVTSTIDEIGGGRSNKISDKVGNTAIEIADKKREAEQFVRLVEQAVDQLPDVERDLIKHRYMSRNHNYISDYTVYEIRMHISDKTYRKIRKQAFNKLYDMLYEIIP